MRGGIGLKALALVAGIAGNVGMAAAADMATKAPPAWDDQPASGWSYQLTLYGWATSLNGKIGVRDLPES